MMAAAAKPPRKEHFALFIGARPPSDDPSVWTTWGKKWHWTWTDAASAAPPLSAWRGEVVLKEIGVGKPGSIALSTNVRSLSATPPIAAPRHRFGVQVLQSALQKAVRRRQPTAAVRLARALQTASWTSFIRRLPIIIIEDSTLHPALPLIIWLLVSSSKGWAPSQVHLDACLTVVYEVASCCAKDVGRLHSGSSDVAVLGGEEDAPPEGAAARCATHAPLLSSACDALGGRGAHAALVRSILTRARFGGMKCDVAMLERYSRLWFERFRGVGTARPPPLAALPFGGSGEVKVTRDASDLDPSATAAVSSASPNASATAAPWLRFIAEIHGGESAAASTSASARAASRSELQRTDLPLAAIDFHCTDVAREVLRGLGGDAGLEEGELKSAIWSFSSSVNHRRRWREGRVLEEGKEEEAAARAELSEVWVKCESAVRAFARRYITARIG